MLGEKTCSGVTNKGQRCRAKPLPDSDFCTFHDERYVDAVQEGRKVGGQRRRREGTLSAAYDFNGTRTMEDLQRLLDIAAFDAVALESSVAKVRALVSIVITGTKVLEVGELEDRLAALESALGPRVLPRSNERRRR